MKPSTKNIVVICMLFLMAQGCSNVTKKEKKIIPITSTNDVLENLKPAGEIFEIKPGEENLLHGEEGTVIFIPANAFAFADGSVPAGKVSVELKECYSLSNIISENLSTISENQFLQTAGMVFIKATADGKELSVKKDKAFVVGFPKQNKTDTMELFYDYKDKKGNRTWVVDYKTPEADAALKAQKDTSNKEGDAGPPVDYPVEMTDDLYDNGFMYCLTTGTFYDIKLQGLNKTILEYIDDPTNIDDSIAKQFSKNEWRVHVDFKIDKNGRMYNFKVVDDEHTKYNDYAAKVAENFFKKAPPFDMSTYKSNFEFKYDWDYSLGVMGSKTLNQERFKAKFRNKFAEYKNKAIEKLDKSALEYYMFSVTKLGWINCDRFLDLKEEKTDYVVKTKNAKDCKVQIVFEDINSIMNGTLKDDGFVFNNVPLNRKIKIIGISYLNGKPTLSTLLATTNKNGAELNSFKEFSLDQLEAEMNSKN